MSPLKVFTNLFVFPPYIYFIPLKVLTNFFCILCISVNDASLSPLSSFNSFSSLLFSFLTLDSSAPLQS